MPSKQPIGHGWSTTKADCGDDDQIVPISSSALLSAELFKKSTLKVYEKFPYRMCTTHADVINTYLLAFLKG